MSSVQFADGNLLFRALFEQTNDAVFIMNLDGVYLVTNQRAADMLGYSLDELAGMSYRNVVIAEEQPHSEMVRERLLAGEAIPVYERHFRRRDGSILPVEINLQVVRDQSGQPIYFQSIVRDISTRKMTDAQALELALEQERSRILAEFIINASHEFRTPLSNINASLHILRRVDEPVERDKRMNVIQNQVDRIAALVSKMLLMTRLDSDETSSFVPLDLSDVVYDAEVSLSRLIEQRRIRVDHDVNVNLPACAGDLRTLHIAFTELLDNAIKFSPLASSITIQTSATPDHVVATIRDGGIGIARGDTHRIFDRFFRGDRSYQHYGFGLGLSIARRIIEQHGGQIEVESEPGIGSTFRVMLPVAKMAFAEAVS